MIYSKEDILGLDRVNRINLINSVTGVKPANLIGSKSEEGYENLAIFSSVVHIGSDPALLGFVMRPQKYQKSDTYKNITSTSFFSLNSISKSMIKNAHYTSAKIPFDQSEFDKMQIEKEYIDGFHAPFVKDSIIRVGLALKKEIVLPNECVMIIGDIMLVSINDTVVEDSGHIDFDKSELAGISGVDTYYSLTNREKMPYVESRDVDLSND